MSRESFDEDILYDGPEMFIVDQSIDEDQEAEEDLFFNHLEMSNIDSILSTMDDEIDSVYVDYSEYDEEDDYDE